MTSNLVSDLALARAAPSGRALVGARSFRVALQGASLALCVVLWHWVTTHRLHLGIVNFENVPSPSQTLDAAWSLLHSPKLARHLASSLQRVAWGYVIAAAAGIVCGLAIGRSSWARIALLPPLEVLRPIPAVAWIPLAILCFHPPNCR